MSTMTLYHVDGFGAFTGETSPARRSPADKGEVWLIPEGTTPIAPPMAVTGQIAVFAGGTWSLVEDHRGQTVYDKVTRVPCAVDAPGSIGDGYTLEPLPSAAHKWSNDQWVLPLDEAKAARVAEIGVELARRNEAGFVYGGTTYQLDDLSQGRIIALAVLAQANDGKAWPQGFNFIAADNSAVPFTAADFVTFATAAAQVVIARQLNARSLKDQILAVVDAAALAAIDITTGWD